MNTATHVRITTEALRDRFQPGSLPLIIRANLAQDRLTNLVGHPEIHFDDSAFAASERYVEQQRQLAVQAISRRDRRAALHAFGRLLHGRQDFYAHSNWAARWVEQQGGLAQCRPEDIDLCPDPRAVPGLISGTGSAWHFLAVHVPLYGRLHRRFFLPANSHEAMNLDDSSRGPLFPFAVAAAIKHTRLELELLLALIDQAAGADAVALFLGKPQTEPDAKRNA